MTVVFFPEVREGNGLCQNKHESKRVTNGYFSLVAELEKKKVGKREFFKCSCVMGKKKKDRKK